MRDAKEWEAEFASEEYDDRDNPFHDLVRAIQADALESAAKVCDKNRKSFDDKADEVDNAPHDDTTADAFRHWCGMSEGAEWCADAIRKLARGGREGGE